MTKFSPYLIGAAAALAFVATFSFAHPNKSQGELDDKKQHRIVLQLTSPDTAVYRGMLRQVNHIFEKWPTAQVEVVVHSKGISMLVKEKTNVQPELAALKTKGVVFSACENTMHSQKLEKSQMVAECDYVPAGIVAIIERQEQGWSYIKAGY